MQRAEVFLKLAHLLYRTIYIAQLLYSKVKALYVLVGYFILILKKLKKTHVTIVWVVASTMSAWERMQFLLLICGLKG